MDARNGWNTTPPHSLEAEMSLLGSMIIDYQVIPDITPLVNADSFYAERNGVVFETLTSLYNTRGCGDPVQIHDHLRDRGVLDDIGGAGYIRELAESVPVATNAKHYAGIVRDKKRARDLIRACGDAAWRASNGEPIDEVLGTTETRLYELNGGPGDRPIRSMAELVPETARVIDEHAKSGGALTGLSTGYRELDELTCGLQDGELTILAARPSMGKTALALCVAEAVAEHTPVLFCSMEMGETAITQRLLSMRGRIRMSSFRDGTWPHYEGGIERFEEACDRTHTLPIHIDDSPNMDIMDLRARATRHCARHGIACVVIDYLQLMGSREHARAGRQNEVAAVSRGVKALARDLNLPVVCLSQLNRGVEGREDHRPRMSDLRESGSIEQDADAILLLHREEYYHRDDRQWLAMNDHEVGRAELILAKQRNGPLGTVELKWEPQWMRFSEKVRSGGA